MSHVKSHMSKRPRIAMRLHNPVPNHKTIGGGGCTAAAVRRRRRRRTHRRCCGCWRRRARGGAAWAWVLQWRWGALLRASGERERGGVIGALSNRRARIEKTSSSRSLTSRTTTREHTMVRYSKTPVDPSKGKLPVPLARFYGVPLQFSPLDNML